MNTTVGKGWLSRNWKWFVPVLCLIGLLVLCSFIGAIYFGVTKMMKSTDAYQMAVQEAESNPEVVTDIGRPIQEGYFMTGNITTSGGSESADLAIPIFGPKGKATIYVSASESVGKWDFKELVVEIENTNGRIDLLQEHDTP